MAGTKIASDGLPARIIKPHTWDKFDRHEKYCGIFTKGMANQWRVPDGPPGSRLGYLELFAGPGRAILDGDELDGASSYHGFENPSTSSEVGITSIARPDPR